VIRVRQHPVVLLRALLVNVAALVVLIGISRALEIFGFLLLYLFPLAILFFELGLWYGRKFIVTPSRVIKEESLFPSSSVRISLIDINAVVHRQSILGKILRYGSIKLEVAGQEEVVALYFVPGPAEFSRCILRQREYSRTPPED